MVILLVRGALSRAWSRVCDVVEGSLGLQLIFIALTVIAVVVAAVFPLVLLSERAQQRCREEAAPYIARCSAGDWAACEAGLKVESAEDFCKAALAKRLEVK